MISLKCKNCGGEMSIDLKGELFCPYCGTKQHFSDEEFRGYKNFRQNMLNYLRASVDIAADRADDLFLWSFQENVVYYSDTNTRVSIDYLFYFKEDNVDTYVAKDSVIFVFDKKDRDKANRAFSSINMLKYPSADLKGLSKYFPTVKARVNLKDGGFLVAVAKPENVYPLFAFGSLKPEHVAWIVSRLENICCVFEFSQVVQNGISVNSVFINSRTHEAYLYGGWWNAYRKTSMYDQKDLYALRKVARQVVGEYKDISPAEFVRFISSHPAADAYSDFSLWDEVIEKGFGGHKFTKFSTN